jgi:hypothetical protein
VNEQKELAAARAPDKRQDTGAHVIARVAQLKTEDLDDGEEAGRDEAGRDEVLFFLVGKLGIEGPPDDEGH